MSDNEEKPDAAKDAPSEKTQGVSLDGVRPYEVARLAIELRKIPENENQAPNSC